MYCTAAAKNAAAVIQSQRHRVTGKSEHPDKLT
ncbi:hypothetical protein ATHEMM101B_20120 [Atlantibacter hermannii]